MPHKKIKGAPDYDDASYWDTKFATGQDVGEWLNKGDVLLDAAITELEQRYKSNHTIGSEASGIEVSISSPRVLHLGPGISALGSRICQAFVQRGWKGSDIVVCNPLEAETDVEINFRQLESATPNVDFSLEAVRIGRESEREKTSPDHIMHWIKADLCSWEEVSQSVLPLAPFDVIIDKSTSDAIATSVPRTFHRSSSSFHDDGNACDSKEGSESTSNENDSPVCPYLRDDLLLNSNGDNISESRVTLSPVELLSIHLASLTTNDTIWLVLSYSSVRFDRLPSLSKHWTVASRTPLRAPAGQASSTTAMVPDVFHWVYVLRRK